MALTKTKFSILTVLAYFFDIFCTIALSGPNIHREFNVVYRLLIQNKYWFWFAINIVFGISWTLLFIDKCWCEKRLKIIIWLLPISHILGGLSWFFV